MGWLISIYSRGPNSKRLAKYYDGDELLDWLDQLVEAGEAVLLESNCGYPERYSARAEDVIPFIPPDSYFKGGDRFVHREDIAKCSPDEQLEIKAMDTS